MKVSLTFSLNLRVVEGGGNGWGYLGNRNEVTCREGRRGRAACKGGGEEGWGCVQGGWGWELPFKRFVAYSRRRKRRRKKKGRKGRSCYRRSRSKKSLERRGYLPEKITSEKGERKIRKWKKEKQRAKGRWEKRRKEEEKRGEGGKEEVFITPAPSFTATGPTRDITSDSDVATQAKGRPREVGSALAVARSLFVCVFGLAGAALVESCFYNG